MFPWSGTSFELTCFPCHPSSSHSCRSATEKITALKEPGETQVKSSCNGTSSTFDDPLVSTTPPTRPPYHQNARPLNCLGYFFQKFVQNYILYSHGYKAHSILYKKNPIMQITTLSRFVVIPIVWIREEKKNRRILIHYRKGISSGTIDVFPERIKDAFEVSVSHKNAEVAPCTNVA